MQIIGATLASLESAYFCNPVCESHKVVTVTVEFQPAQSTSTGDIPLQFGTYVCFQKQQKVEGLFVNEGGVLIDKDNRSVSLSYFVINIEDTITKTGNGDTMIRGQKVSTLLSQLETDRASLDSGESENTRALGFLNETMEGYRVFKLMERYRELAMLPAPTAEEKKRMEEIFNDVQGFVEPFIPVSRREL